MTLYVLYNVYNEIGNLHRSLGSVLAEDLGEVVPVFVDGRYPDYEGDSDLSTDGTRDFALEHGHLIDCVDYECEKRTAGLRYIDEWANDGDWVLYLDADEEITGWFGWPTRVGQVSFKREHGNVSYDRSRIYRWEPGLEFKHKHYLLFDAAGNKVCGLEGDGEMCALGIHRNKAHSKERFTTKRRYYKKLRAREELVDAG